MIPAQPTPAQRAAMQRRYNAAQTLERARQIVREAAPFGLITQQHVEAVHQAELEYDSAGAVA